MTVSVKLRNDNSKIALSLQTAKIFLNYEEIKDVTNRKLIVSVQLQIIDLL